MNHASGSRPLLAIFAVIGALSACTYANAGIFYTIEKEVFIPDASDSLKNDISVNGLARLGTNTYVGARSLFRKADGKSEWSIVRPSEWGTDFTSVLSLAGNNSRIYVVVSNSDATQSKLMNYDGSVWSQSSGTLSGKPAKLTPIYDSAGTVVGIYLSVHKSDNTYEVHDLNLTTGAINAAISLSESIARPVLAATDDGSNFYLTVGDGRLFKGTLTNLTKLSTSFGADLGGVGSLSSFPVSSAVFVSLSNGKVAWSTNDGVSWTQSSSFSRQSGENPVRLGLFFTLHGVTVAGSTVAGKQGGGLYEIVSDGSGGAKVQNLTSTTTNVNNYTSTALYGASVTAFLPVGSSQFYVGTLGKGLFRQNLSDKGWTWE